MIRRKKELKLSLYLIEGGKGNRLSPTCLGLKFNIFRNGGLTFLRLVGVLVYPSPFSLLFICGHCQGWFITSLIVVVCWDFGIWESNGVREEWRLESESSRIEI